MPDSSAAFASFEKKWLAAHPESAVVAAFLPAQQRMRAAAFGCLVHEISDCAFYTAASEAAAAKLNWWSGELTDAAAGRARHPITQVLFADPAACAIEVAPWQALVAGALTQLDTDSPCDLSTQLAQARAFYAPAAHVESALFFGAADSAAATTLWTLSHLLHEATRFARGQLGERPPFPLDLLARHGASRTDLAHAGRVRTILLRDYLAALAKELDNARTAVGALTLTRRVRARLDCALVRAAQSATDPLDHLAERADPGRWRTVWYAWSEARRNSR